MNNILPVIEASNRKIDDFGKSISLMHAKLVKFDGRLLELD
jgi:hypothetical protein